MKVLVIADRPPEIDLEATIRDERIELVITLGDLTREDLLPLERVTHIPKIGVYGNHDSGTYMLELGIMNMHMMTWEYKGLKFGGFQGCVRYKESKYAPMFTQEEANLLMSGFPYVDVFLSHCPPRGINDEPEVAHQGFDGLRNYLDLYHPKVWLHGHTYPTEETLIRAVGDTRIEYVYRTKLLEL